MSAFRIMSLSHPTPVHQKLTIGRKYKVMYMLWQTVYHHATDASP